MPEDGRILDTFSEEETKFFHSLFTLFSGLLGVGILGLRCALSGGRSTAGQPSCPSRFFHTHVGQEMMAIEAAEPKDKKSKKKEKREKTKKERKAKKDRKNKKKTPSEERKKDSSLQSLVLQPILSARLASWKDSAIVPASFPVLKRKDKS